MGLLLSQQIVDRSSGKPPTESGWTVLSETDALLVDAPELRELVQRNSEGEVRVNLSNAEALRRLLSRFRDLRWQIEFAYAEAGKLPFDRRKVSNALTVVKRVVAGVRSHPEDWPFVIFAGWERMLATTGLPAPPSAVIQEGFSPRDWPVQSGQGAIVLASRVASDMGKIQPPKGVTANIGEPAARVVKQAAGALQHSDNNERVLAVLRWEALGTHLSPEVRKLIGILWFAFRAWEAEGLLPDDEKLRSQLLAESYQLALASVSSNPLSLDELLENLETEELGWASNLIALPHIL